MHGVKGCLDGAMSVFFPPLLEMIQKVWETRFFAAALRCSAEQFTIRVDFPNILHLYIFMTGLNSS